MATTTRELELVLIAKNRASSTIARVGGALAGLSRNMGLLGAAGVGAIAAMTKEAADFQQKAALAFTQVEGVANASIRSIEEGAKRIARNVPVELEQVQDSFYDLFSTIDVSNMVEAEKIIGQIAKGAAAGQAPMEALGRSVIAWLNALDQPAILENVNKLLNIQAELVRKGAGTFEEMAKEVGKAIPAFVKADQTVESFSGTMAFLTRNGLNAAMAATSAARGVELLYGPKAVEGLKKYNIALTDAAGKTRAMVDVLRDLVPLFSGKTIEQRALLFKEIFSQGRIQARRFFDTVIPNFAEFERLLQSMTDATKNNVMEQMYETMLAQPLSQIQLLRNNFQALRIEMGQSFWNEIAKYAVPSIDRLLKAWNALADAQKQTVSQMFIFSTGMMLVGSVVAGALAALTLLIGMFTAFPVASGVAALSIGGFVATLKEVGPNVWKNWEKIKDVVEAAMNSSVVSVRRGSYNILHIWGDAIEKIWDIIREGAPTPVWYETWIKPVVDAYDKSFGRIRDIIAGRSDEIKQEYKDLIQGIAPALVGLTALVSPWTGKFGKILGATVLVTQLERMVDATQAWWRGSGKSDLESLFTDMGRDIRGWAWDTFNLRLGDLGLSDLPTIWSDTFTDYWDRQGEAFGLSMSSTVGSFREFINNQGGYAFVDAQFSELWESAMKAIRGLVDAVKGLLVGLAVLVGRIGGLSEEQLRNMEQWGARDWALLLENAFAPFRSLFDLVGGALRTIGGALAFSERDVQAGLDEVNNALKDLIPKAIRAFFGALSQLVNAGSLVGSHGNMLTETITAAIDEFWWQFQKLFSEVIPFLPGPGPNPNILREQYAASLRLAENQPHSTQDYSFGWKATNQMFGGERITTYTRMNLEELTKVRKDLEALLVTEEETKEQIKKGMGTMEFVALSLISALAFGKWLAGGSPFSIAKGVGAAPGGSSALGGIAGTTVRGPQGMMMDVAGGVPRGGLLGYRAAGYTGAAAGAWRPWVPHRGMGLVPQTIRGGLAGMGYGILASILANKVFDADVNPVEFGAWSGAGVGLARGAGYVVGRGRERLRHLPWPFNRDVEAPRWWDWTQDKLGQRRAYAANRPVRDPRMSFRDWMMADDVHEKVAQRRAYQSWFRREGFEQGMYETWAQGRGRSGGLPEWRGDVGRTFDDLSSRIYEKRVVPLQRELVEEVRRLVERRGMVEEFLVGSRRVPAAGGEFGATGMSFRDYLRADSNAYRVASGMQPRSPLLRSRVGPFRDVGITLPEGHSLVQPDDPFLKPRVFRGSGLDATTHSYWSPDSWYANMYSFYSRPRNNLDFARGSLRQSAFMNWQDLVVAEVADYEKIAQGLQDSLRVKYEGSGIDVLIHKQSREMLLLSKKADEALTVFKRRIHWAESGEVVEESLLSKEEFRRAEEAAKRGRIASGAWLTGQDPRLPKHLWRGTSTQVSSGLIPGYYSGDPRMAINYADDIVKGFEMDWRGLKTMEAPHMAYIQEAAINREIMAELIEKNVDVLYKYTEGAKTGMAQGEFFFVSQQARDRLRLLEEYLTTRRVGPDGDPRWSIDKIIQHGREPMPRPEGEYWRKVPVEMADATRIAESRLREMLFRDVQVQRWLEDAMEEAAVNRIDEIFERTGKGLDLDVAEGYVRKFMRQSGDAPVQQAFQAAQRSSEEVARARAAVSRARRPWRPRMSTEQLPGFGRFGDAFRLWRQGPPPVDDILEAPPEVVEELIEAGERWRAAGSQPRGPVSGVGKALPKQPVTGEALRQAQKEFENTLRNRFFKDQTAFYERTGRPIGEGWEEKIFKSKAWRTFRDQEMLRWEPPMMTHPIEQEAMRAQAQAAENMEKTRLKSAEFEAGRTQKVLNAEINAAIKRMMDLDQTGQLTREAAEKYVRGSMKMVEGSLQMKTPGPDFVQVEEGVWRDSVGQEVRTGKGRLSPLQKAYQDAQKAAEELAKLKGEEIGTQQQFMKEEAKASKERVKASQSAAERLKNLRKGDYPIPPHTRRGLEDFLRIQEDQSRINWMREELTKAQAGVKHDAEELFREYESWRAQQGAYEDPLSFKGDGLSRGERFRYRVARPVARVATMPGVRKGLRIGGRVLGVAAPVVTGALEIKQLIEEDRANFLNVAGIVMRELAYAGAAAVAPALALPMFGLMGADALVNRRLPRPVSGSEEEAILEKALEIWKRRRVSELPESYGRAMGRATPYTSLSRLAEGKGEAELLAALYGTPVSRHLRTGGISQTLRPGGGWAFDAGYIDQLEARQGF